MSNRSSSTEQLDLLEVEAARSMLDQLLDDARLYTTSTSYKELMEFVGRLRNFAPFNAMLLNIQKPGLKYAATAEDWKLRFGRHPKQDARPLLIMWPFGPVALVYDVIDTEGAPLPDNVETFHARGPMTGAMIANFIQRLDVSKITVSLIDAGDSKARSIQVTHGPAEAKLASTYKMRLNRNHPPATQFVTIAHELAHLYLSHLGSDRNLKISPRSTPPHAQREIEAESVAYILAIRNGVASKSESYLRNFVDPMPPIDIYTIMRAAGQVEQILGLSETSKSKSRKGAS